MIIDENGESLGVMPTAQALALAQSKGLDLIEVSPLAHPPVCKILDYGKFQYQQSRSTSKAKKVEVKGIRLTFRIGQHDMDVRKKQVIKFLDQGHKVKVELRLRGREKAFKDKAKEVINLFLNNLNIEYKVEKPLEHQGGTLTVTITK